MTQTTRLVLFEDLVDWQDIARDRLENAGYSVTVIHTEEEFYRKVSEFEADPPVCFVIDMMVVWTEPALNMPPAPDEVKKNGFRRAGARCQKKIGESKLLKSIPVVFWTILSEERLTEEYQGSLPKNCCYLSKDMEIEKLIEMIGRRVSGRHIA